MSFAARFDPPCTGEFDVDLSICNTCGFDCDVYGYCKTTVIDDLDLHDTYLNDILKQKGYGGGTLKLETICGKNWLILYPLTGAYMIAEKLNIECNCPVVPVKTGYTMGVPGLNVSNVYTMLLEVIDQLSPINQPVDYRKVISVDDMYEYVKREYPESFQHCMDLNITKKAEVINLIEALNDIGLSIVSCDGEITGYIPLEELRL